MSDHTTEEIERLRERVKNLGIDIERKIVTITRQRERIKELEREFNFWYSVALDYKRDLGEYMRRGPDSLTWEPISHAQIDAAWATGDITYDQGISIRDIVEDCLAELGIVRCEECKDYPGNWSSTSGVKCPGCDGHGWVKNE